MENFNKLIHSVVPVWAFIFLASVLVGAIYAAQIVGFSLLDDTLLNAATTRSLHITLMLYGPIILGLLVGFYDVSFALIYLLFRSRL
ncbi:hypothetical protein HUE87_12025 [Candidatus Sulfurimonas marisnigri]|uniref:Uncharacterized protein n=1 Tax=Candidatus Sulfurimonas marisnigri TaxID=2740405 RepID=A0A7S7M029_9BACT|nr:hypothetical protein [Candidatus Sulfurimonas marisnigri]QOY54571.1 hypothetical protein HUE87_12025 [Candidatus Sulfurimonas marisnigri]